MRNTLLEVEGIVVIRKRRGRGYNGNVKINDIPTRLKNCSLFNKFFDHES